MAEIDYMEDYGGGASGVDGSRLGRWANLSGALVSLALIGGLSVWGYKLLMRDVTGVPVVQAMEGAFRVAPEDPGGMRAPHQGLAVNEIAAVGEAGGPVDEVRLAPPVMDLSDEDRATASLRVLAAEDSDPAIEPDTPAMADIDHLADTDAGADRPQLAGAATDVEAVTDAPDDALATDMAVAEALEAPAEEEMIPDDPLIAQADAPRAVSPRPLPRPARAPVVADASAAIDDPVEVNAPTTVAAPSAAGDEVDVAALAVGTRLVQLGAFASGDVARTEWQKIAARFPDYFDGKRRVVQKAESGGKTFYRLRAEGFDDLADTRRFCTALVAGQADCIPVELR